jgi:hypothetical protein
VTRLPLAALRAGVVVLAVVALAGCTSDETITSPTPTADGATPAPEPTLSAESTTDEAAAFFDMTVSRHLEAGGAGDGRTVVDTLVAAGFDKSAMQVTADTTSIGREADTVQFSVLWGDDCLVGQTGATGFASEVAPVLGTGTCLVGTTRAIDW